MRDRIRYYAGYQDFHDGPLMWFCTDFHWAWVVGVFGILLSYGAMFGG